MWQCASCEYVNDDWDESCLRCGVDRVTSEAERVQAEALRREQEAQAAAASPVVLGEVERRILEQQAAPAVTPAPPAAVPPVVTGNTQAKLQTNLQGKADAALATELSRSTESSVKGRGGRRGNELAAILIIAICLIGLSGVGYVAWQRGMIKLPERRQVTALDFTELGFSSNPAYPQNDTLQGILADKTRTVRPLAPHARLLFDCQAALNRISTDIVAIQTDRQALRQQLELTANVGEKLLEDYAEFEEQTITRYRSLDAAKVEAVRTEYAARGQQIMSILQTGYMYADDTAQEAFLLSDRIPQEFEKYGRIDASGYSDQWQETRELRRQLELDAQYAAEIQQAQDWYDTLATLHQEVQKAIKGLGEVSSNRGRLNPAAVKLVILLDDYATKIEGFNMDFEDFAEKLPETDCKTLKELLEKFRSLAQEDHMYCFSEIYRRYSEDRFAELEQYDTLRDHYAYVELWWPAKKYDYQGVYTTYENRWKESWKVGD